MTILRNSAKASQRTTKNLNVFLLTYALLGLLALAGLIFHEGAAPVRAEVTTTDAPAPSPLLPALQPSAQITTPATLSPLDVMVVFDVSGSTEDQTICHDCWVRTSYNPNWPNNGYFNPIPYNKVWKDTAPGGPGATGNQSIPASALCTTYPPQPFITGTLQYLVVEAELYSRNVGDWSLDVRTPGNGFWAIQRGTRSSTSTTGLIETSDQYNKAGDPTNQSSNVCRPNVAGNQIDCTVGNGNGGSGDDVCSSADGGVVTDCSSFIAARPLLTYNQVPGNVPRLVGAAYNADCFSGSGFSGACWSGNPFNLNPGLEQGPSNVPSVEYDFTPTWSGNTYIWIRAMGGGDESYTWAGPSPDQIQPDVNGGGTANNITPWAKTIYWQVDNGNIVQRKDNLNDDYSNTPTEDDNSNNNYHFQKYTSWLPNRAAAGSWRWILLGNTTTFSGTQSTFKVYQGSAGYMVDKIVFTNDTRGNTPERGAEITTMNGNTIPEVLRRRVDGTTQTTGFNSSDQTTQNNAWRDAIGPPASAGSATREACNVCNPAYGYTVDPSQCSCKRTANDTANSGYGSGQGCTLVLTTTNQLQAELQTGLYSGLQPLRSTQEAVKHLARRLDPKFDQLGLVPFSADSPTGTRRTKLQCLAWAAAQLGNPAYCYDQALGTPLSYTQVISAVEQQWPGGGTNIALGIREGLEELGVSTPSSPAASNCTPTINDGNACDREGPVRKVLILMTDGSPNNNPGNCAPSSGWPDLWDGLIGPADDDFECAAYYAYLAAQANVPVFTVGIGAGVNNDLLMEMATGIDPRGDEPDVPMFTGRCGQYFPAATPTDLNLVMEAILAQARSCNPGAPYLEITKSGPPNPVAAGGLLTYTLRVANNGAVNPANNLNGVVVTDVLDSNTAFVSASHGGVHSGGIVTWNIDVLPGGQSVTRTLVVTVGNLVHGSILTNAASTAWFTGTFSLTDTTIVTTSVTTATIGPPPPPSEQIWAWNYIVVQMSFLQVRLENHFNLTGPYDIYLDDGLGNRFKICEMINTSSATNNGDFSCPITFDIPPGFYTLYSTLNGFDVPLATAPQQVEVIADAAPQIALNNGAGGNVVAVSSTISITLVAHQVTNQPFDLYFVNPVTQAELEIVADVWAVPGGPIPWQVPVSLLSPSNPCPVGGSTPCFIRSRDKNGQIYAMAELYLNAPEILLAGWPTVYAEGALLYSFLRHHTPGLAYDLKLSNGISNTVWLGRTGTTNANGDTTTPVSWIIPPGWPNGVYTLTSHLAAGSTPRDPASMTSTNQVGQLGNVQINTPLTCANPLAESGFETVPSVKWLGIGSNGTFLTTSSYAGNQALLADTNRSGANNPTFFQRFTVPASLTGSSSSIRLRLFKNIEAEVDGSDPNDLFYAVIATGPGLTSTLVTQPALIATGVGDVGYNPANWQELNLIFQAASGVNLADYAGQDLYLYFYNKSNQSSGCPPSNCHNTSFYFDDISLTFCTPAAPPQASAPPEVQPGGAFSYTITVANTGSASANGVVLSNRLDDQLNFVSASDGGQHNAGLVTWNIGALPLSQTITRSVAVTAGNVVSGTLFSSTVMLTSTEGLSYTSVVTTRVSGAAAPGTSFTFLPIVLKR